MKKEIEKEVYENFLKKSSDLVMDIVKDCPPYRMVSFRNKSKSCDGWFDLITWPGCLCINGDYGTYVFSRLDDMFKFFRNETEGYINPQYWAEKVRSVDKNSPIREISRDKIELEIKRNLITFFKDNRDTTKEYRRRLWEDVEENVLSCEELEIMNEAYKYNFVDLHEDKFTFNDIFEWNVEEYTYHYLWCCFAISWAIKQYDNNTNTQKLGLIL